MKRIIGLIVLGLTAFMLWYSFSRGNQAVLELGSYLGLIMGVAYILTSTNTLFFARGDKE